MRHSSPANLLSRITGSWRKNVEARLVDANLASLLHNGISLDYGTLVNKGKSYTIPTSVKLERNSRAESRAESKFSRVGSVFVHDKRRLLLYIYVYICIGCLLLVS